MPSLLISTTVVSLFILQPENAKEVLKGEAESQASLVWRPTFVEVSASGDFGFTTGPSEYRAGGAADTSVYYGHFVSVWKKSGNGAWKVIMDVGSSYPKEEKRTEEFAAKQLPIHRTKTAAADEKGRSGMITADSAYSVLVQTQGTAKALENFASDTVRVYRKGKFPAAGKDRGSSSRETKSRRTADFTRGVFLLPATSALPAALQLTLLRIRAAIFEFGKKRLNGRLLSIL